MKTTTTQTSLLLLLFILVSLTSIGQDKPYSISGKVIDGASKQTIDYASVTLYTLPDTTAITGVITNPKGEFTIAKLGKGKYLIKSSFIGYEDNLHEVFITDKPVVLSIPMRAVGVALSEATVSATKSERQQNVEKTTINVSKNIASVSGNLTDVLKGQAGVTVDGESNIYIRGNKNTLVLMDGVPTTLASLSSMPTSAIENIEIITSPDVKYDAEGTGGIINIITKRRGESGFTGRAMLNYNFDQTINGGLNLHYTKGIWDVDMGYNGKYSKYKVNSTLERHLYKDDSRVEQEMISRNTQNANTGTLMLAAKPTQKDIFILGVKTVFPNTHNRQQVQGTQTLADGSVKYINRLNHTAWERKMFESTLSYKHMFERNKNELSFDALFSRNRGSRPAEYFIEDVLLQRSEGGGKPTNMSLQTDYMKAVSATGKLELGIKALYKYNGFDYTFYNLNTSINDWVVDPELTNDLDYSEYIYSAYLMYSDKLGKKLSYKAGARFEYSTSELVQTSTDQRIFYKYRYPFPFIQATYNVSETQNVAMSINRRVTRPMFPQLNPFVSFVDQITYETGNKYLTPETIDKAELNYTLANSSIRLSTNVYYSTSKDFITQVSMLTDADKLMLTYVNGNRKNSIGTDIDLLVKPGRLVAINPTVSLFHTKSTGWYNEIDLHTSDFGWTASLKATIKPEKQTELQVFFSYNSPLSLPQFKLSEVYFTDVSIKRSFLNNKLAVSISVTDIFNTSDWNIKSDNVVYRLKNYSKQETRRVWLGLTFNFNSYKAGKQQKSEDSQSDSSLIRLGS